MLRPNGSPVLFLEGRACEPAARTGLPDLFGAEFIRTPESPASERKPLRGISPEASPRGRRRAQPFLFGSVQP